MRKWGYGLAGLLALIVFSGINAPDPAPTQDAPSASQTQTQTAGPSPSESTAEPKESTTEAAEPETRDESPAPSASSTEPQPETQTQTPQPQLTQEAESAVTSETETSTPSPTPTPTPTQPAAAPAPAPSGLGALLAQLVIEEEFPSGYDRDLFRHWIDVDRDGCDARREVLVTEAVVSPVVGSRCSLTGGTWYSAFDGVTITNASDVDMDHMVPLKEAWDSGAHAWSEERRRAFANDIDLPEALIGVTRSSNRSKGAKDPAEWLPPLVSYHCQYVRDWMVVKITWELSVDAREFNALRSVAAGC